MATVPLIFHNTDPQGALLDPQPVMVQWPEATNYFLNSYVPVTQTITGIPSGDITVSINGTGSIDLTGDTIGTVTEGAPVSFTGTGADLICTITGTVDRAQVENNPFATPIIETDGSAAIRYIDQTQHPYSSEYFNQDEGMLKFEVIYTSVDNSSNSIVGLFTGDTVDGMLYERLQDTLLSSFDSTEIVALNSFNPSLGDKVTMSVRWNVSIPEFELGYRINEGAWISGTQPYDGSFSFAAAFKLCLNSLNAKEIREIKIYDTDKGQQWIEDNF